MNRFHKVLTAAATWLTTMALLLSASAVPVSAASLRGDMNADGSLSSADAVALYRATSGASAMPRASVGDVDSNGKVNMNDTLALYAQVSGENTVPSNGIVPLSHNSRYGRKKLVASGKLAMVDAYDYLHKQINAYQKTIDLYAYGLTIPQAQRVIRYYHDDHPEVFWMTLTYTYRFSGSTFYDVTFDYAFTQSQIVSYKTKLETAADELLKGITSSMSASERARIIHNRLITRAQYDKTGDKPNSHTLLGVMVDKTGVCESYATAYQYLMHRCGIQAGVIVGQSRGAGHMWNFLYLNNNWYQTDVTWDDPIIESDCNWSKYYTYTYFNTTTAHMEKDHTIQTEYSSKDSSYATTYPIPTCTATAENYQLQAATAVSSYNAAALAPILAEAVKNDKPAIFRATGGYSASALKTELTNDMSAMIGRMNSYLGAADRVTTVRYIAKVNATHNTMEIFFN